MVRRLGMTARARWFALSLGLLASRGSGQEVAACLECHAQPDQTLEFPNGDTHSATLDPDGFKASVHGAAALECSACHTEHTGYPHPTRPEQSYRGYALARTNLCEACHAAQAKRFADGVHGLMLAAGKAKAAVCTDCHDPHLVRRLTDARTGTLLPAARLAIPKTCARCHPEIYDRYRGSAHGAALLAGSNPDVPTCIDCHGVHDSADPRTVRFRLDSPNICARCHTDPAKMARYGLSTAVLRTYVADFHGSTVTLFQKERADQATNKPVCYDCHGIHDIPHTADPRKGIRVKENLLKTCQKCHPGATTNFPDAWMSHFIPDRRHAPLVYFVTLFYRILIPGTIGAMLLFVASDFRRRRIERRDAARPGGSAAPTAAEPGPSPEPGPRSDSRE